MKTKRHTEIKPALSPGPFVTFSTEKLRVVLRFLSGRGVIREEFRVVSYSIAMLDKWPSESP